MISSHRSSDGPMGMVSVCPRPMGLPAVGTISCMLRLPDRLLPSPSAYLAWFTTHPFQDPWDLRPPARPSDVPLRIPRSDVRHTPCTADTYPRSA